MKKITALTAAAALAAGTFLAAAPAANAAPTYNKSENRAWKYVKKNAPVAAGIIGKASAVEGMNIMCDAMDAGYTVIDLIDVAAESAVDAGIKPNSREADHMGKFVAATIVGSATYVCPAHEYQLTLYI